MMNDGPGTSNLERFTIIFKQALLTITTAALVVGLCGCRFIAKCPANTSANSANAYAGLWAYPGAAVWIKILPDGRTFQCRISSNRTALRSAGVFREGQINWERLWGTDTITRDKTTITLCGRFGTFTYTKTEGEMDASCQSPF